MPLLRLGFLKPPLLAVLALVGLVCTAEVGLTVREICRPPCESRSGLCPLGFDHSQLLERSWAAHHRLKPLQTVSSSVPGGGAVTLRTNSLGLRGGEVAVPKPAGLFRVLCLGDEAVFSAEVEEDETFAARLQELMSAGGANRVEVINAGVPGYCPVMSLLQFRHELATLEPDLVLLHFDMSDVADDHHVRRYVLQNDGRPSACPHPDLVAAARKSPLRGFEKFHTVQWCRSKLMDINEDEAPRDDTDDIDSLQGRYAWLRDQPPDWSVYIEQALEPIGQLDELVRHWRGRLIVSMAPDPWQVASDASIGRGVRERAGVAPNAHFESRRPFEVVGGWCAAHRIPLVDASLSFQSTPQPARLYLKHSPRLSPLGHELYARDLAQGIRRVLTAPVENEAWPGSAGPPLERAAEAGRNGVRR